ncbi:MAG TPA: M12 family metallo-peptidase [Phycisphaerales bacterium]|nr:M12 family metallo-peptidase [Phycisphaerales bacterium]
MTTLFRQMLAGGACAIAVCAATDSVNADDRFLTASGGALTVVPPIEAQRIQTVNVNFDLLRSLRSNDQFSLPIYDKDYRALVTQKEENGESLIMSGHLFGDTLGQFVIAIVGDAAAGWFGVPGQRPVSLRYGGPNTHYVHESNEDIMPDCAGSPDAGIFLRNRPHMRRQIEQEEQEIDLDRFMSDYIPTGGSCQSLSIVYLDVLMVYTTLARQAAGGVNAIRAQANLSIATMSLAMANTELGVNSRIVRYLEVNYNESGNFEAHLNRLTDIDDGVMDNVHTVRNDSGADFVVLLVADSSSGGLAWCNSLPSLAFSVNNWSGTFTIAHEMGHNLGCAHNPEDVDCYPNTNARGHWFFVPAEDAFRHSIMSYSQSGSSRIPYYSSPLVSYNGVNTGTATRDNRTQIISQAPASETFRTTRMNVWLDFSHVGIQFGTFTFPFNNLNSAINQVQPNGEELPIMPILHIKSSSSSATATITKTMEIRACGGPVTIGQ